MLVQLVLITFYYIPQSYFTRIIKKSPVIDRLMKNKCEINARDQFTMDIIANGGAGINGRKSTAT
jgi:hypothetical protein